MATGAQVIVSELERAGVEIAFGLPGVHNLALWEALRTSPIRLVGVRHEQAAVYAADGYSRASGKLGVAITTTGPGAANTLGAVGEAWASRSEVLVIATDIPSTLRREGVYRGVLHETRDQAAMFAPVVDRVARGVDGLSSSLQSTGVRYLEVPTDALAAESEPNFEWEDHTSALDTVRVEAERPLLWVGGGARDRRNEVLRLAETLQAPVIETYQGRGVMPLDHPLRVGMPPHLPPVGALWDQADVVIAVGDPLDGMTTQNFLQPQPPRLITLHGRTVNYEAETAGKVDAAARETPWVNVKRVRAEACALLDERADRFLDAVSYALPDDANVVCDMCIPGYWIAGFHGFAAPRKLQYPMGWGTLGFAFPAALGAALAGTGPTVSVSGDGGFLFAPGELATVAQERIPLTVLIVDDGGYGMLRYDQDRAGEQRFGVDLQSPDFARLAEAFGLRSETVEGLDDAFGEALARHVADAEPSVLVARAEPLTPPPTTSPNWYRRQDQ